MLRLLFVIALSPAPQDPPTTEPEGFANPELLVSCAWVAEHGRDEGVLVVDVRSAGDFSSGHVPGSVSMPIASFYDPERSGDLCGAEHLAQGLGARGVTPDMRVVFVDRGKSTEAARALWTLEVHGHRSVSVLDGGFQRWKKDGREVSKARVRPRPVQYELAPEAEREAAQGRLSTSAEVLGDVGDTACVMLDTRSSGEFRRGRIPGAVHVEWTRCFTTGDAPVLLAPSELRKLYAEAGVPTDKRIHAY